MKIEKPVEIFCEETNFALVRVPSRKYPGVLIQGDSLLDLIGTTKEALELLDEEKIEEAKGALTYLHDELSWRLERYREVLKEHNTPFF